MKLVSKIVIGGLLVAMASCQRFPNPFFDSKNKVLAEVGDSKLFAYDVSTIFTPGLSAEDSLKLLESYVDQWVKKQLKIEEAERMFEESQEDIDRLVQEYRNSLLTHKVDQFYVDKYIDTLFTADQTGGRAVTQSPCGELAGSYGVVCQERFRIDRDGSLDRYGDPTSAAAYGPDAVVRLFA